MPVYLKTNSSGNIALKTGGVPQSQINELLENQKEKLEAEHKVIIDGLNEAHEAEVNELSAEINDLNTDIDNLEAEIEELNEANDSLETQVEGLTADNTALNAQVGELTEEVGNLNTTVDNLEAEVDRLENVIETNVAIPVEGVEF